MATNPGILVRLDPELLAVLDEARGASSRPAFIRDLIRSLAANDRPPRDLRAGEPTMDLLEAAPTRGSLGRLPRQVEPRFKK